MIRIKDSEVLIKRFFAVLNLTDPTLQLKKDDKGLKLVQVSGNGQVLITCKLNKGGYEEFTKNTEEDEVPFEQAPSCFIYGIILRPNYRPQRI